MVDVFGTIFGRFDFKQELVGIVLLICLVLIIIVLIIKKIKDNKIFNILVEVVPIWSYREEKIKGSKSQEIEQAVKKGLFGKTKTITISKTEPKEIEQKFISYFTSGAFVFNKDTGSYDLILKEKGRPVVSGATYNHLIPINYKKYKRYLKVVRYSPTDYKPCKIEFDSETIKEIRNVYDNEATYISIKTQDEVANRLRKKNWMQTILPSIMLIVMIVVFIIGVYMLTKSFKEAIESYNNQLAELTKTLSLLVNNIK